MTAPGHQPPRVRRDDPATPEGVKLGRTPQLLGILVTAVLLAVVVPAMLVAQVEDVGRSSAWPLTLALTGWAGLRLSVAIVAGRAYLFDFFFWLFTYIFMGLAPTVQIRSGLISRTTPGMDEGLDLATAVLVWTGVICYEIGRILTIGRERRRRSSQLDGGTRPNQPSHLDPVTAVSAVRTMLLIVIGVGASAFFVSRMGFSALFGSRELAQATRAAIWADPAVRSVIYSAAIYPLLVGIGALSQLRRTASRSVARSYLVLMIAATVLLLLVVNPLSSARYSLGTVLFALVVYAGAVASPGRIRATLAAVVVGFVFLFPIADAFRGSTVSLGRDSFFGEYKGNPDYDAFWQIANAHSYVVDGLVEPGRQALGVVLFWVPRGVWPDKPVDTGILLAQYRGYSFDNLSAPLWSEFLVNGGTLALVLGFILVGYLLRVMDTKLLPAIQRAGHWAIVGAVFPVYMTILLRGSLLQATGAVAVTILCLLFVRQHTPSGARPEMISVNTLAPVAGPPQSFRDGDG